MIVELKSVQTQENLFKIMLRNRKVEYWEIHRFASTSIRLKLSDIASRKRIMDWDCKTAILELKSVQKQEKN